MTPSRIANKFRGECSYHTPIRVVLSTKKLGIIIRVAELWKFFRDLLTLFFSIIVPFLLTYSINRYQCKQNDIFTLKDLFVTNNLHEWKTKAAPSQLTDVSCSAVLWLWAGEGYLAVLWSPARGSWSAAHVLLAYELWAYL
jgi:hypothetical protein